MSDTLYKIAIPTKSHTQMLLITREVEHIVEKSGVKSGICVVFSPYSTSCVTINENADPSVRTDIMKTMDKLVPWEDGYRHQEGNSAAHIKSSLLDFSEVIIIEDGKLLLGKYQGIFFLEYDGPREDRMVYVKIIEG